MRLSKTCAFLACTLSLGAGVFAAPTPLIIDTDSDVDDWWAIAYLLKKPDASSLFDIKAITIEGNGWSNPIFATPNALYLLDLLGCPQIPVAYGSNHVNSMLDPSGNPGPGSVPANLKGGVDNMFKCMTTTQGRTLPPRSNTKQASPISAVELIIDIIMKSSTKVDVLVLGPMTNLAQALIRERDIVNNIGTLYISGANFDGRAEVPQSYPYTTKTKGSNWNFFADPLAAQRVLATKLPMIFLTSMAQDDLPVDVTTIPALTAANQWLHHLVVDFAPCTNQPVSHLQYWDPSAAMMMLQAKQGGGFKATTQPTGTVCTDWKLVDVLVVLNEGGMFGRTIDAPGAATADRAWVCNHASKAVFEADYWATMNQPSATCPAVDASYLQNIPSPFSLARELASLRGVVAQMQTQLNTLSAKIDATPLPPAYQQPYYQTYAVQAPTYQQPYALQAPAPAYYYAPQQPVYQPQQFAFQQPYGYNPYANSGMLPFGR